MMSKALLSIALCCLVTNVSANAGESPLFPEDAALAVPLQLTLTGELDTLIRAKADATPTISATLTTASDEKSFDLKVRPRGKSRRTECNFPPLRLDFKKKQTPGTIFAGQNRLKLVTHCDKKFSSREYLAREMLVYRLLNVLSPASFRVRAVQMTYVDTKRGKESAHHGFLIEHKRNLAKRMGGELLETERLSISALDAQYAATIGLFQFMVGNTDFSLRAGPQDSCCHNAVPIQMSSGAVVVPYDFDVTGLVDAPYASPAPNLSIRRVSQRLYRGYCDHNDLLPGVIAEFLQQQDALLAVVQEFDDIPGVKPERAVKYLEKFFAGLRKDGAKKLIKRCR